MLLDTGGGLRKAAALLAGNEPVLIHNVDILSNIDFSKLLASHTPDRLATVVVSNRETSRYLLFDNENNLQGWNNIKTGEVKPHELNTAPLHRAAFAGIHVVSPRIFELMQAYPDMFSIIDFYLQAMSSNRIAGYTPDNFTMLDVGKIDTLTVAESFIKGI